MVSSLARFEPEQRGTDTWDNLDNLDNLLALTVANWVDISFFK